MPRTSSCRRGVRRWRRTAAAVVLLLCASAVVVVGRPAPAAAALPSGFSEVTAFGGLVEPMAVRFAPDGRVFVAEKRGTVQMFSSLGDASPTTVADLRTEVHNYWDRGLLGLAVDPGFPQRPYLYVLYTFDGRVGGRAPRWGSPGVDSDPCPTPPGPTADGCVVSAKLARLTLSGSTTRKTDLVQDWCQQYPSHSIGDLVFGRDGALYASAGDGASFTFADHGQAGSPPNPCGDPPAGVGGSLSPPTAEGGALRSQDLRTRGDPVSLDGTVIRVSPETGAGLPDNPLASSPDPNARRIVAYGMRNPFRMTGRPGTDELWLGDVGWGAFEELNRLPAPAAAVRNLGWPCMEGAGRNAAYDAADLRLCEALYATPTAVTAPYFAYRHGRPLGASDTCRVTGGSSVSGVAFTPADSPYPSVYDGALFLSDYSRKCIWTAPRGSGGLPDMAAARPFLTGAAGPVDLEVSPRGELFYVAADAGAVRRIVHVPGASCPVGQYVAEYFANPALRGAPARTACEPAPLANDWGTGAPPGVGADGSSARWTGTFGFASSGLWTFTAVADDGIRVVVDGAVVIDQWRSRSAPATHTARVPLTAGRHQVTVEWFDAQGTAVAAVDWAAASADGAPTATITSPAAGTTWRVGDTLTFAGSATDPQDGALPPSRLSWEVLLHHCGGGCHAHPIRQWHGVSGGSFSAPDHEYPSHLEIRLTATDSGGVATTVSRRLDPRTVGLTVASRPSGLRLSLGSRTAAAPFPNTLIAGSTTSLAAPTTQASGGRGYRFVRWSDGGARTHLVTAGRAPATVTATYTAVSCRPGEFRAEYFPNRTLSGASVPARCEAAPLVRDWGWGGPGGVGVNNFSARWKGSFVFPAGTRTFTAASSDGMQVWLDGRLIVDRWDTGGTTRVRRYVPAGVHKIAVRYWEGTGRAVVRLTW